MSYILNHYRRSAFMPALFSTFVQINICLIIFFEIYAYVVFFPHPVKFALVLHRADFGQVICFKIKRSILQADIAFVVHHPFPVYFIKISSLVTLSSSSVKCGLIQCLHFNQQRHFKNFPEAYRNIVCHACLQCIGNSRRIIQFGDSQAKILVVKSFGQRNFHAVHLNGF